MQFRYRNQTQRTPAFCLAGCLVAFLFLCSCSQEEQPVQVDLSKKAEVSVQKDSYIITYAYLPQYSHRVAYERHNPLIEYLKKETGLPIKQIFPDTFDEHKIFKAAHMTGILPSGDHEYDSVRELLVKVAVDLNT